MIRPSRRLLLSLTVALSLGPEVALSQGTGADSLLLALGSPDWATRHAALQEVNRRYPGDLPVQLSQAVVTLVGRESASSGRAAGEGFGEYVMELAATAARTRDPRAALAIVRMGGLGASGAVMDFVASQGPALNAVLDSLAAGPSSSAEDAIETYAMMYARHGDLLSTADSGHVLALLVAASGDTRAQMRFTAVSVSSRGPFPELAPLVAAIADSDGYLDPDDGSYALRRDAAHVLPRLQQAYYSLTPRRIIATLERALEGMCASASEALRGQCEAMEAFAATAGRQLAAGQTRSAVEALRSLRDRAAQLDERGVLPHTQAVFLMGNAAALVGRLGI